MKSKNRNLPPPPKVVFLMLLIMVMASLGLPGCTGIVTYIKSDTRNDNVQCEPDESQVKFGKRSCVIIQQGKTTTNNTSTQATVPTDKAAGAPTDEATPAQPEADHE